MAGCSATPVEGLWPPADHQVRHRIDVIRRGIHTFILIYPSKEDRSFYREYGFAEKGWYLEGRQGNSGIVRSLFWPTDSVIEIKGERTHYVSLNPEKEVGRWTFYVTSRGRQAMIQYLESWYDPQDLLQSLNGTQYYSGRYSYHFFRGCHHYTAGALRAGGLPVQPWWAFNEHLMVIQLDRAKQIEKTYQTH